MSYENADKIKLFHDYPPIDRAQADYLWNVLGGFLGKPTQIQVDEMKAKAEKAQEDWKAVVDGLYSRFNGEDVSYKVYRGDGSHFETDQRCNGFRVEKKDGRWTAGLIGDTGGGHEEDPLIYALSAEADTPAEAVRLAAIKIEKEASPTHQDTHAKD